MLRKIEASDGRRGDYFGAENDAGYSPSGDRVLDFDADRTDLFARRASVLLEEAESSAGID